MPPTYFRNCLRVTNRVVQSIAQEMAPSLILSSDRFVIAAQLFTSKLCMLCESDYVPPDMSFITEALSLISYTYKYAIDETRTVIQHWEERTADIVRGSYSFQEPDGKIRVVSYQVSGKAGFRAVVTFRKPPGYPLIGHLKYPKYYIHPVPLVKPVAFITADLFKIGRAYPNLPE